MRDVPENGLQRPTQSEAFAGMAFILAHIAMIAEVVRTAGVRGAELAVAMLITNGIFAIVLRVAWRIRLVPILAIFTTTAMTEALVWRSAWEGRRTQELAYLGLCSAILLAAFFLIVQRLQRRRNH